jgi:hypothetical protein
MKSSDSAKKEKEEQPASGDKDQKCHSCVVSK